MPSVYSRHWLTSCNLVIACPCEGRPGCHLTTLFGNTAVIAIATPKKKRSLLPLLTVLFIFSYGLMTLLIIEQGATIQSQSNLIKVLVPDSRELWSQRGKALGDRQKAMAQAEARGRADDPSAQIPDTQSPSAQSPSTQSPSNQVAPQAHTRAGKTAKPQVQLPPVPASDLLDQRRSLHSI